MSDHTVVRISKRERDRETERETERESNQKF